MDLYILRHAIAVERDEEGSKNDFDRPLTSEGEQKLRRIAKAMRNLQLSFDLILSSPYVRARETAEIVAASLVLRKKLQMRDSLGVDGNPRELITEIQRLAPPPSSILLVGHEPFLSNLISLLVTGTVRSQVTLKKAGLCKLTVDAWKIGRCARLEWLLTPRQMLLMS
jgi:phosphohistidine phosphatase